MDVQETTMTSMGAASRVATFIGKGEMLVSPEVGHIIPEKCKACGVCMEVCPVNAVEKSNPAFTINAVSCVGCGICVPKCPEQAIALNHCTDAQLIAQIKGVCGGGRHPKIVAFLEREMAYGAADLAGQSRETCSPNVEIISVPTTGRVGLKHVLHAFAAGADGIIFVEAHGGVFREEALREHVIQLKKELRNFSIKSLPALSISSHALPVFSIHSSLTFSMIFWTSGGRAFHFPLFMTTKKPVL